MTCSEKRRRFLKSVELHGAWQPMCFNCAGQALAFDPVPASPAELREALQRDRRALDRRIGRADGRVFRYERRVGERRAGRGDDCTLIDDDMIIEIVVDFSPGGAGDPESFEDMTRIREIPVVL